MDRVPDLIYIDQQNIVNLHPEEASRDNPLLGDYYVTVKASGDSTYNLRFTIKREIEKHAVEIKEGEPITKTLLSDVEDDFALFHFSPQQYSRNDDLKI